MDKFTTLTAIAAPMPLVNIDTDMIIPKQFLKTIHRSGLGKNLFDEMRFDREGNEIADFVLNQPAYRSAEIIVAGDNFGCGSSREHAPVAIKASGITCVIAATFARIFYRNAINIGLPLLEVGDDVKKIKAGDVLSVDLESGEIVNTTSGETIKATPLPGFIQDIARAGGLINYVKGSAQ